MLSREWVVVALAAGAFMACNRNSSKEEELRSVTNTNAVVPIGPASDISSASNASVIRRYGDESSVTRKVSKLRDTPAVARTAPFSEEVVAVMTNGAEVTEVAREGDWYLVLFNDPNDVHSNKQMAGWIYKDAILGPAADMTGTNPVNTCQSGEVHVLADHSCRMACARDSDCTTGGGVCDGSGQVQYGSTLVREGKYCVSPHR
jgi:hypothetical protein